MKTTNTIFRLSALLCFSLFLSSCASTQKRSEEQKSFEQAQDSTPYFRTFNSNWVRHGA